MNAIRFACTRRARTASFVGAISVGLVVTSVAPLSAAPVWWKNIPDAFQHQKWGAKPGENTPLPAIAGAADPGGDALTELDFGGGKKGILGWELSGVFNPNPNPTPLNPSFPPPFPEEVRDRNTAVGLFNGWCNIATSVNLFYHFKQKGFAVTSGAVNNASDLHKEVRSLAGDMFTLPGYTGLGDIRDINKILEKRKVNPTEAQAGLTAQSYKQEENNVKFMSSDGMEKDLPKTTLFDHLQTAFSFGDAASLRLRYDGNPGENDPQRALWWRGPDANPGAFHSVAVAGFDTADNGTIWFADPDSNPKAGGATGNKNSDAGWSEAFPGLDTPGKNLAKSSDNWLAAAGDTLAVKQRRFAADHGVPKPTADPPSQADQDKLYFKGTLKNTKTQFAIAAADYKRYDTVKIQYLETLEVVKAGKKPRVPVALNSGGGSNPNSGDTGPFTFQVSPGQPKMGPDAISGMINEFFLFPSSEAEQLLDISNLRVNNSSAASVVVMDPNLLPQDLVPDKWSVYYYGQNSIDPWGNPLPWGGVSVRAGAGVSPLMGLDLLEFEYLTRDSKELSAWDFLYNDSAAGTRWGSLGVQVLGGGYNLAFLQSPVPEPSAYALVACALGLGGLRRFGKRLPN